jgi:hypothetical protein
MKKYVLSRPISPGARHVALAGCAADANQSKQADSILNLQGVESCRLAVTPPLRVAQASKTDCGIPTSFAFLHDMKQDGGHFPATENKQPMHSAEGWVVSEATRAWIC